MRNRIPTMVLRRLAIGAFTLFAISIIIFAMLALLPGDFAKAVLGTSATPETVAAFQKQLGLDQPLLTRYLNWISGVVTGDFGYSFTSRGDAKRHVLAIIEPRLMNTVFLAAITAAVAVPLAIGLGILAAVWRGGWLDRISNTLTLSAVSMPEFFLAYMVVYVFSIRLGLLPAISNISPNMPFWERVQMTLLPAGTLILIIMSHMMRTTKAAIIGLLANPYVEMASLKGMPRSRVILKHVLPNAWAPIANVVALNLAYLIVGVVVVEAVFTYPGLGQMMIDSVRSRDVPVVQACAVIFAATYILLNLAADLISLATNPRLTHPK